MLQHDASRPSVAQHLGLEDAFFGWDCGSKPKFSPILISIGKYSFYEKQSSIVTNIALGHAKPFLPKFILKIKNTNRALCHLYEMILFSALYKLKSGLRSLFT